MQYNELKQISILNSVVRHYLKRPLYFKILTNTYKNIFLIAWLAGLTWIVPLARSDIPASLGNILDLDTQSVSF